MMLDVGVWAKMQDLIDLEARVSAAMKAEREPPYELRRLYDRVKLELRDATIEWHEEMKRHNRSVDV